MRSWFLVGCLVLMQVAVVAQVGTPQDAETFEQQLAHLRKGE